MARKVVSVNVTLTPVELADFFWELNQEEQAEFFNRLGEIAEDTVSPFEFQMYSVGTCPDLTKAGRYAMTVIGDYSKE